MRNPFLKIIITSVMIALSACSKDDPTTNPVVIVPPVDVTDALTTQNAKNYMVDKNATTETVALFYNLKKSAKTKIAIGQQDA